MMPPAACVDCSRLAGDATVFDLNCREVITWSGRTVSATEMVSFLSFSRSVTSLRISRSEGSGNSDAMVGLLYRLIGIYYPGVEICLSETQRVD